MSQLTLETPISALSLDLAAHDGLDVSFADTKKDDV